MTANGYKSRRSAQARADRLNEADERGTVASVVERVENGSLVTPPIWDVVVSDPSKRS